jgi:hypothetical protein
MSLIVVASRRCTSEAVMRLDENTMDVADIRTFVDRVLTMDNHQPLGAAIAMLQAATSLIAGASIGERIALADTMMQIASELMNDDRHQVN